jgi:hypothetical protein
MERERSECIITIDVCILYYETGVKGKHKQLKFGNHFFEDMRLLVNALHSTPTSI